MYIIVYIYILEWDATRSPKIRGFDRFFWLFYASFSSFDHIWKIKVLGRCTVFGLLILSSILSCLLFVALLVDYHKRFTNNTNRWVSFDSTQSLWLSHVSTKAFLGKSLGFMHVLIQRPSIIGESMFISSVVAFRSRSSDYKFPPARSINRPCNATHGEYGWEHSRDELWRSQVERWSWLLVGGSPPSYQADRVTHGRNMPWQSRVDLWTQLDLQEGSSWRHRILQAARVPERVDADSGPRRMWVRRVIQPWRSVALESSRGELERIIYPHWTEWNSCTHQCRSNFRSHASGWPSEACDSHSAKAVFCLLCWSL